MFFNEIILDNPVVLDASQELWFGYKVTHNAGEYPIGADQGPPVRYFGDMGSIDGINWDSLSGFTGWNWNLRAYLHSSEGETILLSNNRKKIGKS